MIKKIFAESQGQPRIDLPESVKRVWRRLKSQEQNLGHRIGDPDIGFLANQTPPGAAAFVTTEDAERMDGSEEVGDVNIIRFNPQTVNRYFERFQDPSRFDKLDEYIRALKETEKTHNTLEEAKEASEKLFAEIMKADPKAYEDLQASVAANIWLFVTIVHEMTHLAGQQEIGEMHDENKAQAVESQARKRVVKQLFEDLPEIFKKDPAFLRQLGMANDKMAEDKVLFAKKILKVASQLDKKGQFEMADSIDEFIEEFLNEY